MEKRITTTHRFWLKNVENSIFYKVPLENVGVNSKRLDILFDMELVQYGDLSKGQPIYIVSEKGKGELNKLEAYIAKKRAKLKEK